MNNRISVPEILERKNRRDRMKVLMIVLLLVSVFLVAAVIRPLRVVPSCNEDVSIIGFGSFENGRWSHYACGPALDDYLEWSTNSY